jgi:antitoxin component YwqK of YwqJK toxin-antitoxin module
MLTTARPSGPPRQVPGLRATGCISATAVLLAMAACSSPEGRPVSELVLDGGRYLEPETLRPFSGLVFATFDDAPHPADQGVAPVHGTNRGPLGALLRNRQVRAQEHYEQGVRHGLYRWYSEDGGLFEEGTFQNGHRYRAYWDADGLYEEGSYPDGAFDGPRRWYKDGRLLEEVTYRRGVIDGLYERYREDGSLDLKGLLEDGEPCGIWFEGEATVRHAACGSRSVAD